MTSGDLNSNFPVGPLFKTTSQCCLHKCLNWFCNTGKYRQCEGWASQTQTTRQTSYQLAWQKNRNKDKWLRITIRTLSSCLCFCATSHDALNFSNSTRSGNSKHNKRCSQVYSPWRAIHSSQGNMKKQVARCLLYFCSVSCQ